jgi:ATP-binding cassette subfamily B protein
MREQQEILGTIGVKIQQNIFGMKVVRSFQGEERAVESYKEVEGTYLKNGILSGKLAAQNMPLGGFVLTTAVAAVYMYGANLLLSPTSLLTVGQIYMFSRYVTRLTMPSRTLSMMVTMYTNAKAGAERIFAIMDEEPDVKNKADAITLSQVEGEVKFEHVYFEYLPGKPAIEDIDFLAKPGEIIAILGATGSGKSTLIYLIPRFYDATKGRILIDGIDVRDVTLKSLRQEVGVVLQEVFLFTGTVRDNIAFGKPDATQEEVETVAKLAKAHEFIMSFPQGYNTMVGERGITLSGGQKQRIAIARTLITNPKILILDDSLSFVDAKTEQDIQQALKAVMKGRTSFVIAQRLSTIKNADRIMILENGRIAEMGTHEELVALNGIYKRIYETQFEALNEVPPIYGTGSQEVP